MFDLANCVIIECCRDCAKHEWCTTHDEERYQHYFSTIKREIEMEFDNITVYANLDLRTGRQSRPTLGAFEILFRGELIFSKLYTGTWPHLGNIMNRIDILRGGIGGFDDRTIPRIPSKNQANMSVANPVRQAAGGAKNSRSLSQPHSPQSFHIVSPESSMRGGRAGKSTKNHDTSFESGGYLPSIKGAASKRSDSNSRIDDDSRRWPKTKFYRRNDSPLRLHALNRDGDGSFASSKKEETLDYMSFETRNLNDETGRDKSVVLPSINQAAPRKFSLKNRSMQTDELKEALMNNDDSKPKSNKVDSAMQTTEIDLEGFKAVRTSGEKGREGTPQRGNSREKMQGGPARRSNSRDLPPLERDNLPVTSNETAGQAGGIDPKDAVHQQNASVKPDEPKTGEVLKSIYPDEMETPIREPPRAEEEKIHRSPTEDSTASLVGAMGGNEGEKNNGKLETGNSEPDIGGDREKRVYFPQKKRSLIQVPKEKGIKKKITIPGDKDEDCIIRIETETPEILNMEGRVLVMTKEGGAVKVSLKFEPQPEAKVENFILCLYKNNQPWLKVAIQAQYI